MTGDRGRHTRLTPVSHRCCRLKARKNRYVDHHVSPLTSPLLPVSEFYVRCLHAWLNAGSCTVAYRAQTAGGERLPGPACWRSAPTSQTHPSTGPVHTTAAVRRVPVKCLLQKVAAIWLKGNDSKLRSTFQGS